MATIEKLFFRLGNIYNYKWTGQFPADKPYVQLECQKIWYVRLKTFTELDIKRGLKYCLMHKSKEHDYIPTPDEFADRCLPSIKELCIPDVDTAYKMATKQDWSSPIVWHAVESIGTYVFRHGTQKDIQLRFVTVYSKLVQRAREGEKFMIPSNPQLPNLTQKEFKRASPEVRKREMEKICKLLPGIKRDYLQPTNSI